MTTFRIFKEMYWTTFYLLLTIFAVDVSNQLKQVAKVEKLRSRKSSFYFRKLEEQNQMLKQLLISCQILPKGK